MSFYIGLTGNIGSGKSTVAKLFAEHGIEVISADLIARKLTEKDTSYFKKIIAHYGEVCLNEDGSLNRRKLREIILTYPEEKVWLEKLLHPAIRKALENELKETKSPYALAEIPLLYKAGHYPFLKRILSVIAPLEAALKRIVIRDHCSIEQAKAMLDSQPNLLERIQIADDLIFNDSDFFHLQNQVDILNKKYLEFSAKV